MAIATTLQDFCKRLLDDDEDDGGGDGDKGEGDGGKGPKEPPLCVNNVCFPRDTSGFDPDRPDFDPGIDPDLIEGLINAEDAPPEGVVTVQGGFCVEKKGGIQCYVFVF